MAGKFFTLEEAAERLGVSPDEVQRLVDRKQLYPVRDGTTLKFKHDDIERHASEAAAGSGGGSGLSLDMGPADGVELDLGEGLSLDGGASGGVTGSGVSLPAAQASPAEGLSLDGELDLGDIVDEGAEAAPQATPPGPAATPPAGSPLPAEPITGTLPIDLSGIDLAGKGSGTGSNATGSIVGGSGSGPMEISGVQSNVGSALSGVLEGGLSLEDSDVRKSGILSGSDFDKDMESAIKSGPAASGLVGEQIEEFEPDLPEEGGGSDLVADESETAGSSFLPDDASEDFSVGDSSSALDGGLDLAAAADADIDLGGNAPLFRDTTFSVWQVCGLVCCALLMLTGGFVMLDLVRTLGSLDDLSMASPLLSPMAELFGWRR